MKKLSRNKVLGSLTAFSAVLLMGGVGFTALPSSAEEVTPKTVSEVSFTTYEGASVRLNADEKNGLRYGITMSETDYAALMANVGDGKAYSALSFGILLAPASYETDAVTLREDVFGGDEAFIWATKGTDGEWVAPAPEEGKKQIVNFESAGMIADENNEGMMRYYGSLVNIKDANRAVDFVGVGYIKYVESGETKYLYTVDNDNTRSIAYVASKAIIKDQTDDTVDYSAYNTQLTHYVKGALTADELAFVDAPATTGEREVQLNLNTKGSLAVEYSVSDESVATVDATGKLTAKGYGAVTVYAKIGNLFSAETTVTFEDNRSMNELLTDYTGKCDHTNQYARTNIVATVKNFSSNFAAPSEIAEEQTYLQYDITATKGDVSTFYSVPFNFCGLKDTTKVSELLQSKFSVTDWSDAYIGFWVYNDTDSQLGFYSTAASDRTKWTGTSKVVAQAKTWTYIEYSIKNDYGFTTNIFSENFQMFSYYSATGYQNDAYVNFSAKYYIAGFDIYNKTEVEPMSEMLLNHYVAQSSLVNANYAKTTVTASEKAYSTTVAKPTDLSDDSTKYVEYNVKATGAIGNYYFVPFNFSNVGGATAPVSDSFKETISVTDWSNAYVGFWVYNDTDIPLTFVGTKAADRNYWGGAQKTVAETKKWQYIEFSLKDDYDFTTNIFAEESYHFKIFGRYSGTNYSTADTYQNFAGKLYITGFDIYNK